jgi:hypothetical protein
MKGNKEVLTSFFEGILNFISSNSSKSYSIVTIKNLQKSLSKDFPFVKLVRFNGKVRIDTKIDSINPEQVGGLLNKIIEVLGPDILRMFIREKMDPEDLKYLSKIGVSF